MSAIDHTRRLSWTASIRVILHVVRPYSVRPSGMSYLLYIPFIVNVILSKIKSFEVAYIFITTSSIPVDFVLYLLSSTHPFQTLVFVSFHNFNVLQVALLCYERVLQLIRSIFEIFLFVYNQCFLFLSSCLLSMRISFVLVFPLYFCVYLPFCDEHSISVHILLGCSYFTCMNTFTKNSIEKRLIQLTMN